MNCEGSLGATCSGDAVKRDGYTEREDDSSEGYFLKLWKLNCLVGEELIHLKTICKAQVKLVLKCLQSVQETLMFT